MGSSSIGDIVATVGLDTRKWYDEAAALGTSAKGLGGKIHEGLEAGRGQLAVQAFSASLSGGIPAAASVATDALSSYVGKFGALGSAIGVVAGVGISTLIGSLVSEKDSFDNLSSSVDASVKSLDAFIDRQTRLTTFKGGLSKIASDRERGAVGLDLDTQLAVANKADEGFASKEAAILEQIHRTQQALTAARMDPEETWLGRMLGFDIPEDRIRDQLDKQMGMLEDIRTRRRANSGTIGTIEEQKRLLDQERTNIEGRERQAEAEKIRGDDPFASAKSRLQRVQELTDSGLLDRDVGARAGQRIFDAARNSVSPRDASSLRNDANVAGTAAAFSALQDTLRNAPGQDRLNETAEKQLSALEKIYSQLQKNAGLEPAGNDL